MTSAGDLLQCSKVVAQLIKVQEPTPAAFCPLQASTQLVAVLVPLLKVLTHVQVKLDPTLANPVLSSMHGILSLSALSTALQALSTAAGEDESFIRRLLQGSIVSTRAADRAE